MTWLPDPALERLRLLAAGEDTCDKAVDDDTHGTGPGAAGGNRYEILEIVGEGAMGTVHRARDRTLGRDVAVKILRAGLGAAPDSSALADRMRREALILANLEHPGIVPIHDVGALPDGRVYYAMKLVRGRRLDEAVRDFATIDEKLRVFMRICEAVAFAHARGVIHRDLKPENVMVGSFGEVLVMDWGVARVLHAPEGASECAARIDGLGPGGTEAGTVLGTPGYMAPEQAAGGSDRADERSDVYALGAVLEFLLTGAPPATGASSALPGIPRPLAAICRTALAHDARDRYANVSGLLDDLGRFLSGSRVAAYPEPPWDRAVRVLRPYRVAILLVVAYLVMRAVLLLWMRR